LISVALIARQPGTLHAFEILRKHLLRQGCHVEAYNLNQKEQAEDFIQIPDFAYFQARPSHNFQVLITGTSLESEEDSLFWQWARQKSIRSFAFLDQWVNLAPRFENAVTHPDVLLVPEENIVPELKSLGLPSKIEVVGTPIWDVLQKYSRENKSRGLAVFATEPASAAGGQEAYRKLNGYDDMQSLEMAIACLGKSPRADRKEWRLEIKLHPIDKIERVQKTLERIQIPANVLVRFTEKSKKEVFEQADFVFGNRSMLLVEASLVGAYVISFQPHRLTTSPATDREGIAVVTEESQFPQALRTALKNQKHPPKIFSCEAIFQLLKK